MSQVFDLIKRWWGGVLSFKSGEVVSQAISIRFSTKHFCRFRRYGCSCRFNCFRKLLPYCLSTLFRLLTLYVAGERWNLWYRQTRAARPCKYFCVLVSSKKSFAIRKLPTNRSTAAYSWITMKGCIPFTSPHSRLVGIWLFTASVYFSWNFAANWLVKTHEKSWHCIQPIIFSTFRGYVLLLFEDMFFDTWSLQESQNSPDLVLLQK